MRILAGCDCDFACNPIGYNARDIEHFVDVLDFTPIEAIMSATKLGGEKMMQGHGSS